MKTKLRTNNHQKHDFEDTIERFTCIYNFLPLICNSATSANC